MDSSCFLGYVIGISGIAWSIYIHFSNKKEPKIIYETKEISDFNLPKEFYDIIPKIPVLVKIYNNGNISATRMLIKISTTNSILDSIQCSSEATIKKREINSLTIEIEQLHSNDDASIFFYCENGKEPTKKISSLKIMYAEGNKVVCLNDVITKRKAENDRFKMVMPYLYLPEPTIEEVKRDLSI